MKTLARKVMEPGKSNKQDLRDFLFEIFGQARRDKDIDLKGQVRTMLLHGADGDHGDDIFSVELFDLGPVQFSEFHGCHSENISKRLVPTFSDAAEFTRETDRAEPGARQFSSSRSRAPLTASFTLGFCNS